MGSHSGRLADELDELGLWSHLPVHQRRGAHSAVAEGGYPFNIKTLIDWVFVDADVMAEGRGEQVLDELAPILERHGVQLEVATVHDRGDVLLIINGIGCRVTDTVSDPLPATLQPLGVVNHFLERSGASTRVHLLYAGTNYGVVHLLRPEVVQAVRRAGTFPDYEIPELVEPYLGHP
ncbi:hypothetical protein HDA40_005495 [Hamadaea flava]|uniref:Uncharacterized protein n=1 Tax=Hamadaea flava TaxID=1742688 RepID=A0ABV8LXE2_9ACTN|nr:hypothetical protein [Hamadaea flava]MCP2326988.1 hypothetical protein [Hamadaea flava]